MVRRFLATCAALILVLTASTPADDISIGVEIDGLEIDTSSQQNRSAPARSGASCPAQCNSAHSRCNTEVRRARQSCSREAATPGQEPFRSSMHGVGHDSASFCGYFRRPRNCGPGCELRFARHYDLCIDAVDNTAAMRHDCFLQERRALDFCRQELHDCESACKQQ